MSSVDDRIVNMQFNNKQFTQGVTQSQRDLTGLDKTLANAGKASGLGKMGDAATQVSTKFSAMQVAGVTAVATIANKVTLAAGSMLKKLTIQPLIDGFREYTTNLESIQTIMANTGKSVGTVNKYLDQMNAYSDQTIYNFSQMAKNVGTFTAAGVELNTAVSAIKGISNIAALSGSSAQQASTAMYQLSQAIAAGRVGLQDWNSVVNAGMGGKVFKNALAQTAVAMGDLSDNAVKVGTDVEIMGQSFRNSIMATPGSESWLTSDVLVTTLATLDGRFSKTALAAEGYTTKAQQAAQIDKERLKLAKQGVEYSDKEFDAMVAKADAAYEAATQIKTATQLFQVVQESIGSMWSSAFRIILGDFKQSKELWGNVGDVVQGILGRISGGFLGMLRVWEERGGRLKVIDGLANVFGSLIDIFGAVAKGFDRAFPDSKVSLLNRISKAFFAFSEALVPSKSTLEDIGTIAEGFFSIFHLGFTIIKGVAKGLAAFFGALFSSTDGARGGILSMVASIAEVVIKIEDWLTSGSKITRFLKGIGEVAGSALSPIVATIGLVIDAFAALISGEGLGGAADAFGRAKDTFTGFIGGIIKGLDNLTSPFDGLKSDIADLASKLGAPFEKFIQKLDDIRLKIVEGLGLDTIAPSMSGLEEAFRRVNDKLASFAENLRLPSISMEDLGDAADWVTDKFNAMIDAIERGVDKLDIGSKLDAVGGGIKSAASTIGGGISSLGSGASEAPGAAAATGSAAAAATAQGATNVFEKLRDVLSGFSGFFQSIGNGIAATFEWIGNAISSIPFPDDAIEWATVLNALISGALIKRLFFSKGILGELKESIANIGDSASGTFDKLTDTLKTMQGAIKSQLIKNIAIAVALLVASLIALSFVPADKLKNGLKALATVMAMTGAMMQIMLMGIKKVAAKDLIKYGVGFALVGAGMMAMATSVLILTAAVAALAFIPFDKLKQGLGAVAILMGIMVASLLLLSGQGAKVAAVGAAMALMAVAIDTLVLAVIALGVIPFDKLKQGLGAVAIGIGIMTASLLLLSGSRSKILAAGGAMVLMATALDIMVPAIITLGMVPWDNLKKGLGAVAIGIGIMTVALLLLAGGGPAILAAGAAMVLIATSMNILIPLIVTLGSLPWDVVQQGLTAMGIALGILVLAGYLAIGASAGLAALSFIILALGGAMLMAGTGMFLFGAGLALIAVTGVAAIAVMTAAISAFIALLPNIAIQMAAAFVTFVQAIAAASPKLRVAFSKIFREILLTIDQGSKDIDKLFDNLIDMAIANFEDHAPDFFLAGWNVIGEIVDGLDEKVPDLVDRATDMAIDFCDRLGKNTVKFAKAGKQILIDTMDGLSAEIEDSDDIREAARHLATTFADEVQESLGEAFAGLVVPNLPDSFWSIAGTIDKVVGGNGRRKLGMNGPSKDAYDGFRRAGDDLAQKLEESLTAAGNNVASALSGALALFTARGGTPSAVKFAQEADAAQTSASYSSQASTILDSRATDAEERANKQRDKASRIKDKKKRQKELDRINKKGAGDEARRLRKQADRAAAQAEKQQAIADDRAQRARDEMSYTTSVKNEDFVGAGDIRSQQGQDLADKAQAMLAAAQAKADQAAKLANGSKKDKEKAEQLRKQARKEADEANKLAQEALTIQADAQAMYLKARQQAAQAVRDRMADIRKDLADQDAKRAWQDQFDALEGNTQAQADMLNKRADTNAAQAAEARRLMELELREAERLADIDAEAAMAHLDEAERQAQAAQAAADAADADRQQADQLLKQAQSTAGTGTTSSGAQIIPSRTAIEDAAKASDRYTDSLKQADQLAAATASSVTFQQNNYSPEALSASDLYRHGKNLVAAAQIKMAADRG